MTSTATPPASITAGRRGRVSPKKGIGMNTPQPASNRKGTKQRAAVVAAAGPVDLGIAARESRIRQLTRRLAAFIDTEVELPDRHHGPKGRWQHLIAMVQGLVDVDEATIRHSVEWAITGSRLDLGNMNWQGQRVLLGSYQFAHAIAETWTDRYPI
jgi:hypothetical protein